MTKALLQYIQELTHCEKLGESGEYSAGERDAYKMALDHVRNKIIELTAKKIMTKHHNVLKRLVD